jgi:hypothetical protein
MAITASTITKIICDGVHSVPCRSGSELVYRQPRSVAFRLASRAGWFLNEEDACPACATTSGLARTVSFVTSIFQSRRELGDAGEGALEAA